MSETPEIVDKASQDGVQPEIESETITEPAKAHRLDGEAVAR